MHFHTETKRNLEQLLNISSFIMEVRTQEPARKRQKTILDFVRHKVTAEEKAEERNKLAWTEICRDDLNIRYRVVLGPEECDQVFLQLEQEVEYLTGELAQVKVYGKVHPIPRQHAAYGDPGVEYKYSGTRVEARAWTPALARLREVVEREAAASYNFVLVNRYRDGGDKMGDHKDDEKELSREVPIASLSLGAARDFVFKHEDRRTNGLAPVKLVLEPGCLLLMLPPTNRRWVHGLPARKGCAEPRINLTFRQIVVNKMPIT